MTIPKSSNRAHLYHQIVHHRAPLLEWYQSHTTKVRPPIYLSVDLRDSGYKIAPVDTNLYPAGFNNLCVEDLRTAPSVMRTELESRFPGAHKIALLPEAHTLNRYYWENVSRLLQLLGEAGFEVKLSWPSEVGGTESRPDVTVETQSGKLLSATPYTIAPSGQFEVGEFVPDLILLNNDFSSGYPKPLDSVTQPIVPSHKLGWHSRKKSTHFVHYNRLVQEFAQIVELDPWTLSIDTQEVAQVNFGEGLGTDRVAVAVRELLERTQAQYKQHGVEHAPFAFVKNNAGTYGMGILVVHSEQEILSLNRRAKNKMSVGKNHLLIDSVVVQEGILTQATHRHATAEPVIYLFGNQLVGGFLRTHPEKGLEDNLNSQGMVFEKLCMSDLRAVESGEEEGVGALEVVYGAVARIAALAAAYELEGKDPV